MIFVCTRGRTFPTLSGTLTHKGTLSAAREQSNCLWQLAYGNRHSVHSSKSKRSPALSDGRLMQTALSNTKE